MFTNFAFRIGGTPNARDLRGSRNSLGLGTSVAARRGSLPRAAQRSETRRLVVNKKGDAPNTLYHYTIMRTPIILVYTGYECWLWLL